MNISRRDAISKIVLVTLLGFAVLLYGAIITDVLANDCGWSMITAQQALEDWENIVGGFHSDLTGKNAVSYRELIRDWSTPDNQDHPAYRLGVCALDTFITQANAFPGEDIRERYLMDSVFEIARSEMLLGTEDFIEVLDQEHIFSIDSDDPIASPNAIDEEILLLEGPVKDWGSVNTELYGNFPQGRRDCIGHYRKAVNLFLQGLSTEAGYAAFTNQDFSDPNNELANKSLRAMGLFCRASARKVRAYRELADRQFSRDYNRYNPDATGEAKQTTLLASQAAYLEAVTIASVMPVDDLGSLKNSIDFQTIGSNLLEMENMHGHITRGLNPFGYAQDYVAFKFDPDVAQTFGQQNNYEQMNYYLTHDRDYLGTSEASIERARGEYDYMHDRVRALEKEYNHFQQMVQHETNQNEGVRAQFRLELASILGYGDSNDKLDNDQNGTVDNLEEDMEPDQLSSFTNSGEIGQLVIEIEKAKLRVDRIKQDMDNVNSIVRIKSELLDKLIGINSDQIKQRTGIIGEITHDKVMIIKETGEKMANLAELEARMKSNHAIIKGWMNLLSDIAKAVAAGGKGEGKPNFKSENSAPLIFGFFNSLGDAQLYKSLGNVQARRERAAALEKANLVIKEGELQIRLSELDAQVYEDRTNAEFEAEINALLLQNELLTIDLLMAEQDVRQQTMRLNAAIKRALRLLKDREEFEQRVAQTEELQKFYQDPSARVLEDQLIMEAADDFRLAAEMVYLTGKAMEYEINQDFPRLDDVFRMRTVTELSELQQDLWDAYDAADIHNDDVTTRTLSLRRDLLGLPPAYIDADADERFRDWLKRHITDHGDLYIQFNTYLTVGRYDDPLLPPINFFGQPSIRYNDHFPQDRWNEKIGSIRINIVEMRNVDENGVSVSLTQHGTSFVRSMNAEIDEYGYITRDDVRPWNLEARTTGSFTASVNGYLNPDVYYFNDQLVERSVATTDWQLKVQGRGLAGVDDLLAITDIEIVIKSRGYPIQNQ